MEHERTPLSCAAEGVSYKIIKTDDGYIPVEATTGCRLSGAQIGRYEVLRLIGNGGSCLAYYALNTQSGEIVCLKELYPLRLSHQLQREGTALCPTAGIDAEELKAELADYFNTELHTSEAVRYTESAGGMTNDGHFLTAVEVPCEDGTLARYLQISTMGGAPLSQCGFDETLSHRQRVLDKLLVIQRIAETLVQFHKKGFLHLDLKPENIFLSNLTQGNGSFLGNHHVFLLDLGSSAAVDENGNMTAPAQISTTFYYAAPELKDYMLAQVQGDEWLIEELSKKISYSSDIYALASMLFRFLLDGVQKPDFGEYSYTSIKKNADVAALPTPLQNKLVNFIQREMSRDPENRSQTVAELMAALTPLIDALSQPYYLVPNPPSAIAEAQFLGREKQLCELSKLLREHNLVFLSGVGGIGKSELAAQFARRQQDMLVLHATYSAGNPESKDDIDRSGLKQLILSLPIVNYPAPPQLPKLDDLGNLVDGQRRNYPRERKDYYDKKLTQLRALCRENVMLIVDNFNVDSDEGLEDLESLGCKTILTTWCDYQSLYPDQQLTLENSNAEDWTVELFCHQTKRPLNRDKVREIVRRVEYHTTAVILLGAQLQADYMDEATLLERLNHSLSDAGTANVPFRKDGTARRDQRSFAYLQAIFDMAKLNEAEQQLLIKLSFLSAQPFTMEMLREWEPELDMNAFNQLVTYRWISEDQYPTFHLPQVVADVVFESAGEKVMGALGSVPRYTRYKWVLIALPVSNRLMGIPENMYSKSERLSVLMAEKCTEFAYCLSWQRNAKKAESLLRKAIEIFCKLDKKDVVYAKRLAASYYNLATLLKTQSKWEEVENIYREAVRIHRKLALEDTKDYERDLARSYLNLAYALQNQEKWEEAENFYRQAVEIFHRLEKNPKTCAVSLAMSCHNLAYVLHAQEEWEEAENFYLKAIEIFRELARKGPEAYAENLVMSCHNLACLLDVRGKTSEAESLYREAVEINRRLAEKDPEAFAPNLAVNCKNLARLLANQEKWEEAESFYREAIEISRELVRKDPKTYAENLATSCHNLACLLDVRGKTSEAESLYREAVEINRRLAEKDPKAFAPNLAVNCQNLAGLLVNQKKWEEAEAFYREAIDTRRRLAKKEPEAYVEALADSYHELFYLLRRQKKKEKDEGLLREAIEIFRRAAQKNPEVYEVDLVACCRDLSFLLVECGEPEEVERLLQEVKKITRRTICRSIRRFISKIWK